MKEDSKGKEKKVHKKSRRGDTVLLGERDENGKLKTPHTKYGLFKNMGYIFRKMWQYKKLCVWLIILGSITQSIVRYLWSYVAKFANWNIFSIWGCSKV